MNYVEYLRARNCLRVFAIVLGGLILLSAIVRISIANQLDNGGVLIGRVSGEPDTKIVHSVVDGHNRTTITNDREKTTIVIDDYGFGKREIHITEPASASSITGHQHIGSLSSDETTSNGVTSIFFRTNQAAPFGIYLAIAGLAMMIVATILGSPFAQENKDHLEFALLRPVTRTRYALGVIGIDAAGIVLAGIMTIVAGVISQAMFELPTFSFEYVDGWTIALTLVAPLSWYAAINAATASLKRTAGTVVGFSWPAALVIGSLSQLPIQGSPVGDAVHTIFWSVSRVIPLSYITLGFEHGELFGLSFTTRVEILSLLMLIYGALAVVQWRRVEAS